MSKILKIENIPEEDYFRYKMTLENYPFNFMFEGTTKGSLLKNTPDRWLVPFIPDDQKFVESFLEIGGIYYSLVVSYRYDFHIVRNLASSTDLQDGIMIYAPVNDILEGKKVYLERSIAFSLKGTFNYV